MYTIDDLRQIDDSPLTAFQRSLMFHYWRVGHCWESLRTTAKKTGMSLGMAKKERDFLLENGYIQWEPAPNGKMSIVLNRSCGEQMQQLERSQDEQCSPHEQECSPHERHLKKPNEVNKNKKKLAQDEKTAIAFFEGMTGFTLPHETTMQFSDHWLTPIQAILKQSADFAEAEKRITWAIQEMRQKGYTIKSPKSILTFALNWQAKPAPSKNGRSAPGAENKKQMKERMWKTACKMGRNRYREAMETFSEQDKIVLKKIGRWRDICNMDEKTFSIKFYETYNGMMANAH